MGGLAGSAPECTNPLQLMKMTTFTILKTTHFRGEFLKNLERKVTGGSFSCSEYNDIHRTDQLLQNLILYNFLTKINKERPYFYTKVRMMIGMNPILHWTSSH